MSLFGRCVTGAGVVFCSLCDWLAAGVPSGMLGGVFSLSSVTDGAGFALEVLAVSSGLPSSVDMFQPEFQFHKIIHQGVFGHHCLFPHLLSKCKWPHLYHSSFFHRGEVWCLLVVVLGLSFLLSQDLLLNCFGSNRLWLQEFLSCRELCLISSA